MQISFDSRPSGGVDHLLCALKVNAIKRDSVGRFFGNDADEMNDSRALAHGGRECRVVEQSAGEGFHAIIVAFDRSMVGQRMDRCFRASRASMIAAPTNPAPPVRKTFIAIRFLPLAPRAAGVLLIIAPAARG